MSKFQIEDLEELSRQSSNLVQITPPSSTWIRLEQKLNADKDRKKIVILKRMAIAASVLCVISISLLIQQLSQPKTQQQLPIHFVIEDLDLNKHVDHRYYSSVRLLTPIYSNVEILE